MNSSVPLCLTIGSFLVTCWVFVCLLFGWVCVCVFIQKEVILLHMLRLTVAASSFARKVHITKAEKTPFAVKSDFH